MCLEKKNGGVISVYYSIMLGLASIVIAASLLRIHILRSMVQRVEMYQPMHLLYLEMLYYIRNEINDGYYQNFSYEDDRTTIIVTFHRKERIVIMELNYYGIYRFEKLLYDEGCRCLQAIPQNMGP